MKKEMTKLGVTLALFASLACASLAVVYSFTKDRIERQNEIQLNASLKELFPEATVFEPVEGLTSPDPAVKFEAAYAIRTDAAPLGMAVKAKGQSYGGDAVLLIGVDLRRSIVGVRVMELKDTPGLGANATNPGYFVDKAKKLTFPGQFAGKYLTDPFEVKKDVIAITASTITSRSLTNIIKKTGDAIVAYMDQMAVAAPAAGESTGNAAADSQTQAGGK